MNQDPKEIIDRLSREADGRRKAAIANLYKDEKPWTSEELMKTKEKWWVNEWMALRSKLVKRCVAPFLK